MSRKISILTVFLVGLFVTQTAKALPHYNGYTTYEFSKGGRRLSGRIEFAVFDTETDAFTLTPPGDGRYLYAYQIWNDEGDAQESLGYFAILLEGATVDGIASEAPQGDESALAPTKTLFASYDGDVEFFFQLRKEGSLTNDDILEPGAHSYILMFTSDNDWEPGGFEVSGGNGTLGDYYPPTSVPGNGVQNPEPATLLILGTGAGMALIAKKRKSV
jgi:hypothetical protein